MAHDTENNQPSGAAKMFGDFAPALVHFTDDVLFGQVWKRSDLSAKERSLVTVASLTTSGNTDQLVYHLGLAKDNGATEQELIEAITHLAFYAGWPKAMSAMAVAKQVFGNN
jgi:4-carboxymuconolactone decarboxylase